MANFLLQANGVGAAVRSIGVGGFPLGAVASVASPFINQLGAPFGLQNLVPGFGAGSIDTGTKPSALHTEVSTGGTANWTAPYSSGTDILFYLTRADQMSGLSQFPTDELSGAGWQNLGDNPLNSVTDPMQLMGGENGAVLPSNAWARVTDTTSLMTPWQQIANGEAVSDYGVRPNGGDAGPISNINLSSIFAPGGRANQNASLLNSTRSNVLNAVGASTSGINAPNSRSASRSQNFFQQQLRASFNLRTPFQAADTVGNIIESIQNGKVSDLALYLARGTRGVVNQKQMVQGINNRQFGYTPQVQRQNLRLIDSTGAPRRQVR